MKGCQRPTHRQRKRSIYIDTPDLIELRREADRQGRSISWLMQWAWKIARARMPALRVEEDDGA